MTESELKELDKLSKLRGWTSIREVLSISQSRNKQNSTESNSQSCHDINQTEYVCSPNTSTVVNELNQY